MEDGRWMMASDNLITRLETLAVRLLPNINYVKIIWTTKYHNVVYDKYIYTIVEEREISRYLTYKTATGAIIWVNSNCFYIPLFFWRRRK